MPWLTDNWQRLLPQPWLGAALVLVAVVCGGIVGLERERKQKAVGFRTLALVSLGAAVFTMIGNTLDHRTPIAAGVVSGIGFLGAGVILRGPYGITGLASAATIWTTAAVGMTVGLGYGGAGLLLSLFLLAAMLVISLGEQRYIGACRYRWAVLTFRVEGGKSLIKIEEILDEYRFPAAARAEWAAAPAARPGEPSPAAGHLCLRYCDAHRHHKEFLPYLAGLAEIEHIRRGPLDALAPPAPPALP